MLIYRERNEILLFDSEFKKCPFDSKRKIDWNQLGLIVAMVTFQTCLPQEIDNNEEGFMSFVDTVT